jgi:CelD/BcsL family acetyltransferase involved in cellulose biosynthesis
VGADELRALTLTAPSVYQQPAWCRAVEEGVGYGTVGVLSEADCPLALIVYFETRRGPFRLIGSPLPGSFTSYQRPVWLAAGSEGARHEILVGQRDFLRRRGYSSIEWWMPERDPGLEAIARAMGGSVIEVPTLLLDIEPSAEAMWKKMDSRGRNMVRKAERAGVVVRRCEGTDDEVSRYYRMLEGTFAKSSRRPAHPQGFYRALVRGLVPADRLLFVAAEAGGRVLAMAVFVHDTEEMCFLSGTSLPDVAAYAPNNLLQWYAIRFAVERGLRVYDLGGTGTAAVERFKRSVGARPHRYAKLVWRSRALGVVATAYLRARPVLDSMRFRVARLRAPR